MTSDHCIPYVTFHGVKKMQGVALFAALFALVAAAGCGGESSGTPNNLSSGSGPVAAKVTGTIAAGTTPQAVAVDPTSNTIYVANFGEEGNDGIGSTSYCPGVNGTVTTIDGGTQSVVTGSLPPAGTQYPYENPLDLAVNPTNHNVYVAARMFAQANLTCYYRGELQVLKSGTLAATAPAMMGAVFGENVAVNQETGNVYWSDWEASAVTVLDAGGDLLYSVSLDSRPETIAVNAATNKIYVGATYPSIDVIVIDGNTNTVLSTITDPSIVHPIALAVNPMTNTIYVANGQGCSDSSSNCESVSVIDGATNAVSASTPVGTNLSAITVDPQTNFIYVADSGNHDAGKAGSVIVIDGATNAAMTLTDSNLTYPYRIAVNPMTNKIYVLNILSNKVTVIDGAHD